jgi:UDP-N-acetylmuramate dehydrogenase
VAGRAFVRRGFSATIGAMNAAGSVLIARIIDAGALRVLPDEPLARHTTFAIGGKAPFLVEIGNAAALERVRACLASEGMAWRVLGGGSNVLAPDAGVPYAVVRLKGGLAHFSFESTRVMAGAGISMRTLCVAARDAGLAGLESAATLPGTLGGALAGNAGYAGRPIGDVVESVSMLLHNGRTETLARDAIEFGYRRSSLKGMGVILGATLRLAQGDRATIARAMEAFAAERRECQPLSEPSAGCVFCNPPGASAGRLIDQAGAKGWSEGGAKVSPVHANFIVNEGGARAADVRRLIERVRERVRARFGVELELELELMAGDE